MKKTTVTLTRASQKKQKEITYKNIKYCVQDFKLTQIKPSTLNPRNLQDNDPSLDELSENIDKNGLINPIIIRPCGTGFEIVCGERRYKAFQLLKRETIPAICINLSDQEAEEWRISENLQRQNITPVEEANAFNRLIQKYNYTIEDLCIKFGKSESYIRNRLKFSNLIPEFANLLNEEKINLRSANLISCYSAEIQKEIYQDHFNEDEKYNFRSWTNLSPKKLDELIKENYTYKLHLYKFDKSECQNCPSNSANTSLFGEITEDSFCSNTNCMYKKNAQCILNEIKQSNQKYPTRELLIQQFTDTDHLVTALENEGYQVKYNDLSDYTPVPPKQIEPKRKDFKSDAEYNENFDKYQNNKIYLEKFIDSEKRGEIEVITQISPKGLTYYFKKQTDKQDTTDKIFELKEKDKRNQELVVENTVKDLKGEMEKIEFKEILTETEKKLFYYYILESLKTKYFSVFGFADKYYLSSEDRLKIVDNLDEIKESLIIQCFLFEKMKSVSPALPELNKIEIDNFLQFATLHLPDQTKSIQKKYRDVYEKRKKRIKEQIKSLSIPIPAETQKITKQLH